ncbi:MAG: ECF transporter S component [Filifactor alocis]|nr:ECF transporter S component [Filifactor alocis]
MRKRTLLFLLIVLAGAGYMLSHFFLREHKVGMTVLLPGILVLLSTLKRFLNTRFKMAGFIILVMIPLTMFISLRYLGDRKYYFVSLLIAIYTMVPFFMLFEKREPKARELILISVMVALAVAGRGALYFLPHVKPVIAIVIISGLGFGAEAGFLVGAMSAFVSNFFFGQGPWTPWQMFTYGLIGFIAGILFKKKLLPNNKIAISIFGFLSILCIFGPILNPASALMAQGYVDLDSLKRYMLSGLPVDLVHGSATAIFLWFLAEPMLEKIERVRIKYGLLEAQ